MLRWKESGRYVYIASRYLRLHPRRVLLQSAVAMAFFFSPSTVDSPPAPAQFMMLFAPRSSTVIYDTSRFYAPDAMRWPVRVRAAPIMPRGCTGPCIASHCSAARSSLARSGPPPRIAARRGFREMMRDAGWGENCLLCRIRDGCGLPPVPPSGCRAEVWNDRRSTAGRRWG
ncbi:hypothetical protein EDC01DRAFT_671886 [Geopyxis carbonaria]|nr:hypothetical protein EDC01DRAFT_671886 [Geopyxis carbonaria]